MHILTLDIGNTRSSAGMFSDAGIEWRRDFLTEVLKNKPSELGIEKPDLCVISCVSSKGASLTERVRHHLACRVIDVQPLRSPIEIHYEHPEKLGQDRIANAMGAMRYSDCGAIVVDMGTATHFDIIDPSGAFWGGPILAGIETMLDALTQRIPHLPNPELSFEIDPLSQNTLSAIRTGTILSSAGGIEKITSEICKKLSYHPKIFLTGGNAYLVAPYIQKYDAIIPDLTLEGLWEYGKAVAEK